MVTAASEFPAVWFRFKRPVNSRDLGLTNKNCGRGGRRDSPVVQAFIFVSGKNRSGLGLGWGKKLRRGGCGERVRKAVFPHPPSFCPSPSPSSQGLILWSREGGVTTDQLCSSERSRWRTSCELHIIHGHSTFRSVYVRIVFRTACLMVHHSIYSEPVFCKFLRIVSMKI